MKQRSSFSEWLEDELKIREWSISDLAKKAKVSRGHLSNILLGTRRATADICIAIANAFEMHPDKVLRRAGLLPPTNKELAELKQELQHIFDQAITEDEYRELIEEARYRLQRIRERRGNYDSD